MPKPFKLAILRACHDPDTNTSIDHSKHIGDGPFIEMVQTGARSLLKYWTENTDDYLDFNGSVLFPWVRIQVSLLDVANLAMRDFRVLRETQLAKAYAATKVLNDNQDLVGFDGFVLFTFPGDQQPVANPLAGQPGQPATLSLTFDAGGTSVMGRPGCVITVNTRDHTFMCHEIGHVLGFKHTYGVWNNGIDWDSKAPWDQGQIYGDPYDIMSSASFGKRVDPFAPSTYASNPTFAGPVPTGWPFSGAKNMGPAPARAHVHHWDPAAIPAAAVKHMTWPSGTAKSRVTLYAASSTRSPRLIAIHRPDEDPEGRGRCYLELRDANGWDQGLDLAGADLARQGVVAHTIADAYLDGVRCWYRGRILVPLEIDTDLKVTDTPLTVRVLSHDPVERSVELEIATQSMRGIDLTVTHDDTVVDSVVPREMGTPCGDTIVHATWITRSRFVYRAVTYGFGGEGGPVQPQPTIAWYLNGTQIPNTNTTLSVSTAAGTFQVDYVINPVTAELTLTSRDGEKYAATVKVTAVEAGYPYPIAETAAFTPLGSYTGFRPGDLAILDRCMAKYLRRVRLRPQDLLIPPGPDPIRDRWQDRINLSRLNEVARRLDDNYPHEAEAIRTLATLRFDTGKHA